MTSSNVEAQNKKYILMNNLENKHSLLMKFEFMSYYKRKILSKKFYKNCHLKTGPLVFAKN